MLAVVVASVTSGCAGVTAPPLSPPVPEQWRHLTADRPASVDLHGWWHAFGDPQLDALVDTALQNNLDVAQARERLLASRALAGSQRALYLPHVRGKTEDAIDPDASASFFVAGFDAVWELPLFGRGKASAEQARGAVDAGMADLQAARVSLVAEVVRQWLQLRAAQQSAQVRQALRKARSAQWTLVRARRQLHLASPVDVEQARAALELANAAAAAADAQADAHAQSLAALLGRPEPDPRWFDSEPVPALRSFALSSTPADLLRSRPEIARAQAEVLGAVGRTRMARADLFPKIGIGGSVVWSTNLTTHRETTDNAIASAGPMVEIPLFDWGLREAALEAKNHQLKAAVFAYRQAVLDGVADVETALGELDQARRLEEQANARRRRRFGARRRSPTRACSWDWKAPRRATSALAASAEAQLDVIQARARHGLALVRLYKALGGAPLPANQDVK